MHSLSKLVQYAYYVSGVCSASDDTESMNKRALSKSINHICIKRYLVSSLRLENQQIATLCCLFFLCQVYSVLGGGGRGHQGTWPKGLVSPGSGMREVPSLLSSPRPRLGLILVSFQTCTNGSRGPRRLMNWLIPRTTQTQTRVKLLWKDSGLALREHPGALQQGQIATAAPNPPSAVAGAGPEQGCHWACRLPARHFLISLALPQTTTVQNTFSRNWWVWPGEGTV